MRELIELWKTYSNFVDEQNKDIMARPKLHLPLINKSFEDFMDFLINFK